MRLELTLPALERLLGGDTEIEIHLRQQIVEEFARKHLKALANDSTWKGVHKIWETEVNAVVAEQLSSLIEKKRAQTEGAAPFAYVWNLNDAIRKHTEEKVDKILDNLVSERPYFVSSRVASALTEAIDIQSKHRIKDDERFKKFVDDEIERRVEEEIQRRLKVAAETK